MPSSPVIKVVERLRKAALRRDEDTLSDGQLLSRFLQGQDQAAFAAIVRRHGPMVWGVCRRIVGHAADAEDAFQAAFLILVRKAATVKQPDAVGNWLYGVACHTALKARNTSARVRAKEKQVTTMPESAQESREDTEELQKLLDQELSALPDKYRLPVVLCDLEGRTRKEVAAQLKIPEGTLSSRLATAHQMLAKRLARHGLAVSGGSLAALFAPNTLSASVPAAVVSSTIKTATLVAAGNGAVAGVVSAKVAALTEGVLKAMLISKLKSVIAVVVVLGMIVTGATVLPCGTAPAQSDNSRAAEKPVHTPEKHAKEKLKPPPAERPVYTPLQDTKEKEGFTAWGKDVGGLQAGLGFKAGEKRAYSHGETVTLVLRIRNVSKEVVKFSYLHPFCEHQLTVTANNGKPVAQPSVLSQIGEHNPGEVALAPGKEIELHAMKRQLRPENDGERNKLSTPDALCGTGKVSVQYENVLGTPSHGWEPDPVLSKLATGKFELEIESEKKTPQKPEKKDGDVKPKGNTGLPVHLLLGHKERLTSVAYAPDGQSIASAGWDGKVRIWDAKTGKEERHLDVPATRDYNPASLSLILFSPDNEFVVTAQQAAPNEPGVVVWKRSTGEKVREFRSGQIAALSPDGKHIACGERDLNAGVIRLYEFATGKLVREMRGHYSRIELLTFSPDGRTLYAHVGIPRLPVDGNIRPLGRDGAQIRVWDIATGKERQTGLNGEWNEGQIAISPDGRTLALAGTLRETVTGEQRTTLIGHTNSICAVAFSPDGRTLASGSMDGTVRLWDLPSGKELGRFGKEVPKFAGRGWVLAVAFSPDGRSLVSGGLDQKAEIWDVSQITGRPHASAERSAADLEADWMDLGGDAAKAYAAMGRLVSSPQKAVSFLVLQRLLE